MAQDGYLTTRVKSTLAAKSGNYFGPDRAMYGDNGGTSCILDIGRLGAYSGGASPGTGTVVKDITSTGDASLVVTGSNTISVSGNMMDFSNASTTNGGRVDLASNSLADLHAGAHDYFLVWMFVRLPNAANYQSVSANSCFYYTGIEATNPSFCRILQTVGGSTKLLQGSRQYTTGLAETTTGIAVPAADLVDLGDGFGALAMIGAFRTAVDKFTIFIKSVNHSLFTATVSGADGGDNTVDFSAVVPQIGISAAWNPASIPTQLSSNNWKFGRYGFLNLNKATFAPRSFLADEWDRTIARNIFA